MKLIYTLCQRYLSTNKIISSTIFALASGRGKCAVSIFRISGVDASETLFKMCKFRNLPAARTAILRRIYDPESNELLDKGLVLWFPAPNSFTGENACELHVHGGIAVQSAVFNALSKIPKYKPAEAGEFTKRAFYNGKMDLTEVEGVADVIHAETEAQRRQAVLQMDGVLSQRYRSWSKRLLKCLAHIEAYIDFSEDEKIEDSVIKIAFQEIRQLKNEIESHLNDNRRGERLRNGIRVAIVGEPNVGKSSLLNTLCERPVAIVSSIPGTTRDVVEAAYDIGGYPVIFSDTAGLRITQDVIEEEGVRRAKMTAKQADMIIFVLDATRICTFSNEQIEKCIANICQQLDVENEIALQALIVVNKIDLIKDSVMNMSKQIVPISCHTGHNLQNFYDDLKNKIECICKSTSSDDFPLTNQRHRQNLTNSSNALNECFRVEKLDIVFAAENIRRAVRHIGKITGKVTPEDVLDLIFKQFCIGK